MIVLVQVAMWMAAGYLLVSFLVRRRRRRQPAKAE